MPFEVKEFKPKPDITVQELAEIIAANAGFRWLRAEQVEALSKQAQRHYDPFATTTAVKKT